MIAVKPKQSLGQNFLIDSNIVRNIVRDLNPTEEDVVVEIGGGLGALTKELAGSVRHLIVVEIDGRVIDDLNRMFASPDVTIVHQDFLDVELSAWKKKYGSALRLVGNIPYHLTSPILFKVFDDCSSVRDLTIMVQREVARRIVAGPGTKEYGILSVFTRFYGIPKMLFNVSPNCFYPKPRVTSTVLRIRMHEKPPYRVDDGLFRTVVKTTFGKRRKTLRNGLKFLPLEEEALASLLAGIDFPLDKRPEELTVEQFVDMTNRIGQFTA